MVLINLTNTLKERLSMKLHNKQNPIEYKAQKKINEYISYVKHFFLTSIGYLPQILRVFLMTDW